MNSSQRILWMVSSCFWLSGLAALIYQTAWLRRFSAVFGTSEIAVVVVLSSYMAGLALGAVIAARMMPRITRPVLFYGALEAIIAIVALMFPLLLDAISWLFISLFGGRGQLSGEISFWQSVYYFISVFAIILIPTTAMGATLPVLAKSVVSEDSHIGGRIGRLYAINTIGAVAGALLTAFLLLPALGLRGSIYCAVAINLAVFVIAVWLERQLASSTSATAQAPAPAAPVFSPDWRGVFLVAVMMSGIISFCYEVLWTRLLGHILGGSVTAFATMLASFLAGIALGSLISSAYAKERQGAITGFWLCQIAIAISGLAVYHTFDYMAAFAGLLSAWQVVLAIVIMLPTTLFIGATFPLVVRICAPSVEQAPSSAGIVYGWNTVGAIIGAVIAGFFVIPLLKYEGSVKLAVAVSLSIALLVSLEPGMRRRYWYSGLSAAGLLVLLLFYRPEPPFNILRNSPIGSPMPGDIVYYDVGRSATVLVHEHGGSMYLRTNGLPEANTALRGYTYRGSQSPLMSLPALVRPEAKRALVVGLGAGGLLHEIPSSIDSVDVIELEPKVVEANRQIGPRRYFDPLGDSRVKIHIGDARGALQLVDQRWDIVISQPSHPWTAGASHLYTEEFMRLIDSRLEPDGVYLQWMNVSFVSEELLASLLRALNNVFAHTRVYHGHPSVLYFLGSQSPIAPEQDYLKAGKTKAGDFAAYRASGFGNYHTLLSNLLMDSQTTREFAADAEPSTDEHNKMATDSLRATRGGLGLSKTLKEFFLAHKPVVNNPDWALQFLSSDTDWLGLYEGLAFGQEQLYGHFASENPPWLNYVAKRGGTARQGAENPQTPSLPSAPALPAYEWSHYLSLGKQLATSGPDAGSPGQWENFDLLGTTARAVLLAHWHMRAERMEAVRGLDGDLARARPGEPWHASSVQARVAWRLRGIDDDAPEARQRADEAAQMLEAMGYYDQYPGWARDYLRARALLDDAGLLTVAAHLALDGSARAIGAALSPKTKIRGGGGAASVFSKQLREAREAFDQIKRSQDFPVYPAMDLAAKLAQSELLMHKLLLLKGRAATLTLPEEEEKADLSWGEVDTSPAGPL